MKKIIRKTDTYSLEKVNERIQFYQNQELDLIFNKAASSKIDIAVKLLSFWTKYKSNNFVA
jgi:hypothetical protein